MADMFQQGECVKIPDGRIGRVREKLPEGYKIRVRRKNSATHQFLIFQGKGLERVACPKGWMSMEGYNRYLGITLRKMKERLAKQR
jgi:hypothetical protein